MRETTVNQTEWLLRPSALPPLPRLATTGGLRLLRGGAGFEPVATLATSFKKIVEIKEYGESFSVLGGKGGKPGYAAHGELRAMQKSAHPKSPALSAESCLIRKLMSTITTLGGRIRCNQCQAKSKRSQQQCRGPAIRAMNVCRMHSGKGSGPKTKEGRQRCAAAKTLQGFETRKTRTERALGMRRLRELEDLGHLLGIMSGPRTPGRKPSTT